MTTSGTNGNGSPARSGTRALGLLSRPLNGTIVHTLAEGPTRLVDLRRACGSPAQTTLRAHLRELESVGAVKKEPRNRFPGALQYELQLAGRELLFVLEAVESWLAQAPEAPLVYGTREAKAAIKALIEGWSSTMIRALATGPLSLTELDGVITGLNYPSLERRLAAMRLTGQVKACPGRGNGTPYMVTAWLRTGIAPLSAAAQWERRHTPEDAAPVSRLDTEAAFLLTLPLLRLPSELSGLCRMGVEVRNGGEHRLAGAIAHVEQGQVVSYGVRLQGKADAWATGSSGAWLQAVVCADADHLELGGDQQLIRTVVEGLHRVLFGAARKRTASRT